MTKKKVGKRHSCTGGCDRTLRHRTSEVERAVVASRVSKQNVPVIHPAAELHDVTSFDPRETVNELVFAAVLPFRPAVAGITGKPRVPGEREGGQACDIRILNTFEPSHTCLLLNQVDALALEKRRRAIFAIHPAESKLMNERRSEIRCQ